MLPAGITFCIFYFLLVVAVVVVVVVVFVFVVAVVLLEPFEQGADCELQAMFDARFAILVAILSSNYRRVSAPRFHGDVTSI